MQLVLHRSEKLSSRHTADAVSTMRKMDADFDIWLTVHLCLDVQSKHGLWMMLILGAPEQSAFLHKHLRALLIQYRTSFTLQMPTRGFNMTMQ